MKQGNLFDDLYTDQEADDYDDNTNHANAKGLYPVASSDVIKQELVTYYRVKNVGVKKVTKSRNFLFNEHNDTTTIEVFK